jgi:DNA-binding NarL/FixJ family response regulator
MVVSKPIQSLSPRLQPRAHPKRTRPPTPTQASAILLAMPIKVVLAEDNYLVREGVKGMLESVDDLELCDAVADLDTLLAAVDKHSPDVVLTDIRMPPTNTDEGIQASERLRESHPDVGVVVLSQYAEPGYALALLEKGAAGRAYLLKERVSDIGDVANAIREVARGASVIDPKIVELLVAARSRAQDSPLGRLTPRENEILSEMASGKNNAAIAGALFLTERAVEKHINSIFSKLSLTEEKEVHRRVKAVLLFLSHRS